MKKIIWICSYPKSGNTWIRSIVSSLLYSKNGEFNFNLLNLIELFEKKSRYDFVKKVNISDYKNLNDDIEIISKYWLECQKNIVFDDSINPIYNIFKTHSANLSVNSNDFTNTNYTGGIIHVVRDPREVVISYSVFCLQIIHLSYFTGTGNFNNGLFPFICLFRINCSLFLLLFHAEYVLKQSKQVDLFSSGKKNLYGLFSQSSLQVFLLLIKFA